MIAPLILVLITFGYAYSIYANLAYPKILKHVFAIVLMAAWLVITKVMYHLTPYTYIIIALVVIGVTYVSNTIYDESQASETSSDES